MCERICRSKVIMECMTHAYANAYYNALYVQDIKDICGICFFLLHKHVVPAAY